MNKNYKIIEENGINKIIPVEDVNSVLGYSLLKSRYN